MANGRFIEMAKTTMELQRYSDGLFMVTVFWRYRFRASEASLRGIADQLGKRPIIQGQTYTGFTHRNFLFWLTTNEGKALQALINEALAGKRNVRAEVDARTPKRQRKAA